MTTDYLRLHRPAAAYAAEEGFDRADLIGVGCTVVLHLLIALILLYAPLSDWSGVNSDFAVDKHKVKAFDFELTTPPPEAVPPPKPIHYVETNPDAPENTPDKTENFSNKNQQTANPDPDPTNSSHRPKVQGQDEIKNDVDVIAGNRQTTQSGAPPQPPAAQAAAEQKEQEAKVARMAQTPISGGEKIQGDSPDGIAANLSDTKTDPTHAEKLVEGDANSKSPEGEGTTSQKAQTKVQPRQRPKLASINAPHTILQNNLSGSSNIGVIAIDAFKSEYGEYLAELREIIEAEWFAILNESKTYPQHGTHVLIMFTLNSQGEVRIDRVEETAGKYGTLACQGAIQHRQPYRKWTPEMINLLGTEQQMGFDFLYQ